MQNEMNQIDRMPKKNPLSFQIDLSKFEKATDEEKKQQDVMSESASFFKDGMRKLMKNPLAVGSIIVLVAIVLMIVIVPRVVPYGYSDIVTINGVRDTAAQNMAPLQWSEAEQAYIDEGGSLFPHIMGTDEMGRDYFVRVVYGTKVSLIVGIFAALLVLIIGVVYGGISGFVGGKVDMVMMRIIDCIYSIPSMLYVILIMMVFGSNIGSVLLGICVSSWIGMARQVRTQVQTLKQQEFALAAYVIGAGKLRILFKHLIINCMGPIIVSTTLMVPEAIFTESFLAFIGIGISLPQASWGTLASEARSVIQSYPLQIVWPVLAICLTVLSLNFIGDGVGEALDPKNR